jgi:hypothetical protein
MPTVYESQVNIIEPGEKAEHTVDSTGLESVSVALASLSSNIHGHSAYTMVCEIARVPALIAFLRNKEVNPSLSNVSDTAYLLSSSNCISISI